MFSRILPPTDSPSIYETMQRYDAEPSRDDPAGMGIDEENLNAPFQEQDLDHLLADAASEVGGESTTYTAPKAGGIPNAALSPRPARPITSRRRLRADDDDDVPESLLLEGNTEASPLVRDNTRAASAADQGGLPPPVPGPITRNARAHWESTREQQRSHGDDAGRRIDGRAPRRPLGFTTADPRELALWRWANVQNLDRFLLEVYQYYIGHGIWSICLARLLGLLQTAFIVGFTTFLTYCIDYRKVPQSKSLSQVLVPQCTKNIHGAYNVLLWIFAVSWCYMFVQYLIGIPRLWAMHNFYRYLLDIPDIDIQNVSWQLIVGRLMALRDSNITTAQNIPPANRRFLGTQSKQRMDAHDIANRLMRRENYLIALFNKDVLDFKVRLPFIGSHTTFSKTLEWHVELCVMDYVFNESGQVRRAFLSDKTRRELISGLRRRFQFIGLVSILWGPFAILYFCIAYFFRFFTEFQKDPSQLGSRTYTPLAEWKFREFNELKHLFERRRNMSYPYADRYLQQFPKDKMEQISHFTAFVAGALAAVLAVASLIDPELFLGFEITPNKTVLFWLGILTTVYATARNAGPREELVLDPEFALNNVIECTHYYPTSWKGRLHSDEVRRDFSVLYQPKIVIFLEEILSIIFTPIVLLTTLSDRSERIVDFFREFTIHVDGLGHVCSFAVFDFKKSGENATDNRKREHGSDALREDYYSTKDGKMLASYYGFLDNYATAPGRGDARYGRPMSNSRFRPPPAFPGLASPVLGGDGPAASTSRLPSQPHRTPRMRPSASRMAASSVLLDPQHQPAIHKRSPRQGSNTRLRPGNRQSLLETVELEENPEEDPNGRHRRIDPSASRIMEEDSQLSGSWRASRAAQLETDTEEDDAQGGEGGAGVLGLLYQFQKAQTEGRGTGVAM